MIKIKNISSYNEYISLQKEKTTDPKKRKRWVEYHNEATTVFKMNFKYYDHILQEHKKDKVYCLGARTGAEVEAFNDLGYYLALGTDLVPFRDIVIVDDIHNMQFEDNSVGLFYTNILDHSIYPKVFLSEIKRCLKDGGKAFFQLQLGAPMLKYGVLYMDDVEDFNSLLSEHDDLHILISEENIAPPLCRGWNPDLNWNIIIEKRVDKG